MSTQQNDMQNRMDKLVVEGAAWRLDGVAHSAKEEIKKVESYARIDDASQRLVYAGMLEALYDIISISERSATEIRALSSNSPAELRTKVMEILHRAENQLSDKVKSNDRMGDLAAGKLIQYRTYVRYMGYAISEVSNMI